MSINLKNINESGGWKEIPVLGSASAGKPVPLDALPIESVRRIRPIKGARIFDRFAAVRVEGHSLVEDGIHDGDICIVQMGAGARTGDLCVVLTPHGLTIKYLYPQEDGMALLRGANPECEDMVWEAQQISVQGVVRRVERDL